MILLKIVYAVTTANVSVDGNHASVIYGTHWQASDPVVEKYPTLFSDDPRYGLFSTVPVREEPTEEADHDSREHVVARKEEPKRGPGRPKTRG